MGVHAAGMVTSLIPCRAISAIDGAISPPAKSMP